VQEIAREVAKIEPLTVAGAAIQAHASAPTPTRDDGDRGWAKLILGLPLGFESATGPRTHHLAFGAICGTAGTLMCGNGGATTEGIANLLLGLANCSAAPICGPSAARLPPIPAAPPPRPPPPRANEAAGVAKTTNNAIATFTFTEVFDMRRLH
jgi:hypothetical protein